MKLFRLTRNKNCLLTKLKIVINNLCIQIMLVLMSTKCILTLQTNALLSTNVFHFPHLLSIWHLIINSYGRSLPNFHVQVNSKYFLIKFMHNTFALQLLLPTQKHLCSPLLLTKTDSSNLNRRVTRIRQPKTHKRLKIKY